MLGQVFFANAQHALNVLGVFGRHGHKLGKSVALLHVLQPRRNVSAAIDLVELVGHQERGYVFAQERQHFGIGLVEHASFDHKQNQVHITYGTQHGFVQRAVERVVVPGLKARRVDKHKLGGTAGMDAGDAVTRGLRLARGNADFLPHQGVHQGGLAHIGLAHNGHQPAALTLLGDSGTGRHAWRGLEQTFEHALQIGAIVDAGND